MSTSRVHRRRDGEVLGSLLPLGRTLVELAGAEVGRAHPEVTSKCCRLTVVALRRPGLKTVRIRLYIAERPKRVGLEGALATVEPHIFVCLTSAQARIGIPTRLGPTQNATGGRERQTGRCGPLST